MGRDKGKSGVDQRGACRYRRASHILTWRSPVPDQSCRNWMHEAPATLADVEKGTANANGFGPLRVLLGTISAAHADRKVRLHPLLEILV